MESVVLQSLVTVTVAVISSIGTSAIMHKRRKENLIANTHKTIVETDAIMVNASMGLVTKLQASLELHERQIKELQEKIKELEEGEVIHSQERDELQEKIKELNKENLRLRSIDTKSSKKIKELQERIKELETKLSKYVTTN
jgi:chromosome segregation ATPase